MEKVKHAHTISGAHERPTPQKNDIFLIGAAHHYKIVMNGKENFQGLVQGADRGLEITGGTAVVAVVAGVSPAESKSSQPTRLPLQWLVRERKRDGCTVTNFAVNASRAAVEIDNRFYQGQTQACSIRATR